MSWMDELRARAPLAFATLTDLRGTWSDTHDVALGQRTAFLGLWLLQRSAYWVGWHGVSPFGGGRGERRGTSR